MKDWNDIRKEHGSLPSPWDGAARMHAPPPEAAKARVVEPDSFFVGKLLSSVGWLGPRLQPKLWACRCPSEMLHKSGQRFDGSTRLHAPDKRYPSGWINCTHPACKDLWVDECFIGNAVERIAKAEGL